MPVKKRFLCDLAAIQSLFLNEIIEHLKASHVAHSRIDPMQRKIAAKSRNLALSMCINSAKFQKDWIKHVENIAIFASDVLWIHRISLVFASKFAHFSPAMFVFCLPCCTGFWDTYFVEETRKMTYASISSVFGILKWDKRRVPSNQHKQ